MRRRGVELREEDLALGADEPGLAPGGPRGEALLDGGLRNEEAIRDNLPAETPVVVLPPIRPEDTAAEWVYGAAEGPLRELLHALGLWRGARNVDPLIGLQLLLQEGRHLLGVRDEPRVGVCEPPHQSVLHCDQAPHRGRHKP